MSIQTEYDTIAPVITTKTSYNKYLLSYNYQLMIDRLSTPVLLCDKNLIITHANRASLDALNKPGKLRITIENIIGSIFGDFCGPCLSFTITPLENARGECDGAFIDWMQN